MKRRSNTIYKISKEEAEYVRKHAHDARITLLGRYKKGRAKTRYVDESSEAKRLIAEFHNQKNQ